MVMTNKIIITGLLSLLTVFSVSGLETREILGAKCEDITGVEKWDGEGHGDSNPSSNEFDEMIFEDNETTCKVAEAIDHMEIKGEIKDHEWDEFKDSFTYAATSEEVQECFEDRFDLPDDDGDKHLADYEIQKCAVGAY